jgi:hypothetical protein
VQGAEAREIYLGKLFGYGAIARSLRKQSGSSGMDTSMLVQLTQEVSALSRKKGARPQPCRSAHSLHTDARFAHKATSARRARR